MNFTYTVKPPPDGAWGGYIGDFPNGKWNGMMDQIVNEKIDFGKLIIKKLFRRKRT